MEACPVLSRGLDQRPEDLQSLSQSRITPGSCVGGPSLSPDFQAKATRSDLQVNQSQNKLLPSASGLGVQVDL